MANKKISELPTATALSGSELVPMVQGGTAKQGTVDQLVDIIAPLMPPGPQGAPGPAGPDSSGILAMLADTEDGEGADMVGFLHLGTGAVERTVLDRMRETISVLDFIPVAEHAAIREGTSTYDCAPGIQAAIDFAIYGGGFSKVHVPAGIYVCNKGLHMGYGTTFTSCVLEGDGSAAFIDTDVVVGDYIYLHPFSDPFAPEDLTLITARDGTAATLTINGTFTRTEANKRFALFIRAPAPNA